MATDARARKITVHFTSNGKTHGLVMAYGTAQALGIDDSKMGTGYNLTSVRGHSTTRRLYPGGPTVGVSVPEKTQARAAGPSKSGAATNKRLLLRGSGPNDHATIYFSGPQQAAVAWLKANTSISSNFLGKGIGLYSATGRPLMVKQVTQNN